MQKTRLKYKAKATCDKGMLLNQAETSFRKKLSDKVAEYCDRKVLCSLGRVDSDCIDKNTYKNDPYDMEILSNQISHNTIRQKREIGGIAPKLDEISDDDNNDDDDDDDGGKKSLSESFQGDQPGPTLGPDESTVQFQFAVSGECLSLITYDRFEHMDIKNTINPKATMFLFLV